MKFSYEPGGQTDFQGDGVLFCLDGCSQAPRDGFMASLEKSTLLSPNELLSIRVVRKECEGTDHE